MFTMRVCCRTYSRNGVKSFKLPPLLFIHSAFIVKTFTEYRRHWLRSHFQGHRRHDRTHKLSVQGKFDDTGEARCPIDQGGSRRSKGTTMIYHPSEISKSQSP